MVKFTYTVDELLNLRHREVVNLKRQLASLLDSSNSKFGKGDSYINKRFTKLKNLSKNYTYSKGDTSCFKKENKYIQKNSPDKRNPKLKLSPHSLNASEIDLSEMIQNHKYFSTHIQYPFFNLLMFPPGSRIIRIEPGNPLPKGAIPIPFYFDGEFTSSTDFLKHFSISQPNLCINKLQSSDIDKIKIRKNKKNLMSPNPTTSTNLPVSKIKAHHSELNPYSVTGFFPEREVDDDVIMPGTINTCKKLYQKPFTHNLSNTSQTSINDTDSSITVGSSSSDSYNIHIQISATH